MDSSSSVMPVDSVVLKLKFSVIYISTKPCFSGDDHIRFCALNQVTPGFELRTDGLGVDVDDFDWLSV